ncbi:MAG: hypothetical protein LBO09_05290 [Candidatus Peribacteria bacterium]|jgi:hypothetical protein|nr:hypothetical protein [Candidatus Peribacteria bacterium]
MDIYEIKNNIASVDPKNGEFDKFYLYNPTKGKIEPFIFKGFEGKTYEIEAYNTDRNVISIIDED